METIRKFDNSIGSGEDKMTYDKVQKIIQEIEERFGIKFSDYREELRGGKVVFVFYEIKFQID